MITQTDLKRLWKLKKDIRGITIRIRELELPYSGIRYESEGAHSSNVPDLTAHAAQKLIEKREERTSLEEEYAEILTRLIGEIDTIEDPVTAAVMSARFIRGMTWSQTARIIGGYNTADGCRMLVARYVSTLPE